MSAARLEFATSRSTEFVDLTARIRDEVGRAGLRNGRVHLQSLHTTVGLAVNENEVPTAPFGGATVSVPFLVVVPPPKSL